MKKSISTFLIVGILSLVAWQLLRAQEVSKPMGTIPPTPSAETATKLLVIGDSLTSGLYASHEQATFVSILGERTKYQVGRKHASMLPQAVQAWNEVKVWQPSIVILEIGLNDVAKGTLTIDEWRAEYRALIVDIKESGAILILCTTFWGGIGDAHPNFHWYLLFNQAIRELASEQRVGLADLWNETLYRKDYVSRASELSYWGPHYHGDNFHPNDQGHAAIAEEILNALRRLGTYLPLVRG